MKEVHLPSVFNQNQLDREILVCNQDSLSENLPIFHQDNESHFHESLEHWRQLNLAPSFIIFADNASPLSLSMPLLLHHWKEIIVHWEAAMDSTNDEGLRALLE